MAVAPVVVKVTVEYDYRMSDVWRDQTHEAIQAALLPLADTEAFVFEIKRSTLQ
jgi:hypothetical protein